MPEYISSVHDLPKEIEKSLPLWARTTSGLKKWLSREPQSLRYMDHIQGNMPDPSVADYYFLHAEGYSALTSEGPIGGWGFIISRANEIIQKGKGAVKGIDSERAQLLAVKDGLSTIDNKANSCIVTSSAIVKDNLSALLNNQELPHIINTDLYREIQPSLKEFSNLHIEVAQDLDELLECHKIAERKRRDLLANIDRGQRKRKKYYH